MNTENYRKVAVLLENATRVIRQLIAEVDRLQGQIPDITRDTGLYGLSVRARKVCIRLGVHSWLELSNLTEEEILEARNCGVTTLREIKEHLAKRGLALRGSELDADAEKK